jgi:hypothetical protein
MKLSDNAVVRFDDKLNLVYYKDTKVWWNKDYDFHENLIRYYDSFGNYWDKSVNYNINCPYKQNTIEFFIPLCNIIKSLLNDGDYTALNNFDYKEVDSFPDDVQYDRLVYKIHEVCKSYEFDCTGNILKPIPRPLGYSNKLKKFSYENKCIVYGSKIILFRI